ncbi:MAG: hypothetical protein JAY90_19610 [Candidatus Thiodiazotropha lotti]|nr:hypothetical protein [Candidatus Thiodiazotropha lotti]
MEFLQPHPPFETFDPKSSYPTQHYLDDVNTLLMDAREILYDRSREDIFFMVDSISYMLEKYDPLVINMDRYMEMDEEKKKEADARDDKDMFTDKLPIMDPDFPEVEVFSNFSHAFLDPCDALIAMVGFYEIKDQSALVNAKWSEYFAALALALIGESTSVPQIISKDINKNKVNDYYRESFNISFFVMHAMKAVSIAMKYKAFESGAGKLEKMAEKRVKQKVHLSQQLGGIKRHAENNKIKSDFIQFCDNSFIPALEKEEKLNITAAAREYYEEFLEDRAPEKHEDPDGAFKHRENTLRMLTTAWRNYKKTGQKPKQP